MREMDVEVRKIHAVLKLLAVLEPVARLRVLDYVRARSLGDMPQFDSNQLVRRISDPEVACIEQS